MCQLSADLSYYRSAMKCCLALNAQGTGGNVKYYTEYLTKGKKKKILGSIFRSNVSMEKCLLVT